MGVSGNRETDRDSERQRQSHRQSERDRHTGIQRQRNKEKNGEPERQKEREREGGRRGRWGVDRRKKRAIAFECEREYTTTNVYQGARIQAANTKQYKQKERNVIIQMLFTLAAQPMDFARFGSYA